VLGYHRPIGYIVAVVAVVGALCFSTIRTAALTGSTP
jgi:hypothetical protein